MAFIVATLGGFVLVTFLITVVAHRAYISTALVIGSIPAAAIALENPAEMLNPLSWFVVLPIWALGVAGSLLGAWLARLVHARWRRA